MRVMDVAKSYNCVLWVFLSLSAEGHLSQGIGLGTFRSELHAVCNYQ
jgi:hypothetical protein